MKRSTYHTSLAATLGVGSELSRRGYDVAFTLGNMPRIDLLCEVPDGKPFKIQVKGISNQAGFYVQKAFFDAHIQEDLFLIIVWVPYAADVQMRFFILSHLESQNESSKMRQFRKRDGLQYEKNDSGLNWGSITAYEGKWITLPPLTAVSKEQ